MTPEYIVYILIPLVSALIGWSTNYIAVKMIFRPHRPVKILCWTIQGVIPRRQQDLARSLGETVEKHLISHDDIAKILQSDDMHKQIRAMVEVQVDQFILEKIGALPMVAMFLQGDIAKSIKKLLIDQFSDAIPELMDACMTHVEDNLDFKAIVQKKVEEFDYVKLEEIVFRIADKELKTIEILGGVLGFVVGVVQVALLLLVRGG